jgi:CDGSH-type Zn-finger protein
MAGTRITVRHNGSLRIEGDFELVDQDGKPFGLGGRTFVSLCRCGQSKDKPFCDGSHKLCGFADVVVARDLPPKPTA